MFTEISYRDVPTIAPLKPSKGPFNLLAPYNYISKEIEREGGLRNGKRLLKGGVSCSVKLAIKSALRVAVAEYL